MYRRTLRPGEGSLSSRIPQPRSSSSILSSSLNTVNNKSKPSDPPIFRDIQSDFSRFLKSSQTSTSGNSGLSLNLYDLESPSLSREVGPDAGSSFAASTQSADKDLEEARLRASEFRRKAKELTYELSNTKTDMQRKILSLEADKKKLESQINELKLNIEKLEQDRRTLHEHNKESTEKLRNLEKNASRYRQEAERALNKLQEENRALQNQMTESQLAARESEGEASQKVREMSSLVESLENALETSREQLKRQTELTKTRQQQLEETQLRLAKAKDELQSIRSENSDRPEFDLIRRELHDQVDYVKQLESRNRELQREVAQLREKQQDVLVIKKRSQELENRLMQFSELRIKLNTAELENEKLLKKLAARGEDSGQVETLEAELRSRDALMMSSGKMIQEWKEKCQSMEERHRKDQRLIKRLERSKELAQREVEFLRQQLKTLDSDETVVIPAQQSNSQAVQRAEMLEKMVDEYRKQIRELTEETKALRSAAPPRPESIGSEEAKAKHDEALQNKLKDLEQENADLKHEIEILDKQVGELEQAVGRGEYDRRTTKILQLKENPAAMSQVIRENTLSNLRAENNALLQQIRELQQRIHSPAGENEGVGQKRLRDENQGAGAAKRVCAGDEPDNQMAVDVSIPESVREDLVPRMSFVRLKDENQRLENLVAEKDKRMMRLKEVYKTKAQEVREAVFSLLGYKLDILENGRVRLTSIYSEKDDHSFVFTSEDNDSGTMQLIGGGNMQYVRSLENHIKFWVVERGSIPAFLSTVTLELFEKTTVMQGAVGGSGAVATEG
ncbi:uncharacterized protein VTP21DRAFT_5671 [Calcarisporiella thermophila]|uniref:uncharacterized protein n=1 Tax=Calcarisporiella thermophila TaxID=911321 RepID=UPI003742B927